MLEVIRHDAIKIMIAENDDVLFYDLKKALNDTGFIVIRADDTITHHNNLTGIDLLIVDLNFSGLTGHSTTQFIKSNCKVPIIVLDDSMDKGQKIAMLNAGADDHFIKPVDIVEFLAHIDALLRRISQERHNIDLTQTYLADKPCNNTIHFANWIADPEKYEVISTEGTPCSLTTGDFALLMLFLKNAGTVLSRDQISNALHGHDWSPYDRSIDNHVSRLRRKIEVDPTNPEIIKTVRGAGYTLIASVRKFSKSLSNLSITD